MIPAACGGGMSGADCADVVPNPIINVRFGFEVETTASRPEACIAGLKCVDLAPATEFYAPSLLDEAGWSALTALDSTEPVEVAIRYSRNGMMRLASGRFEPTQLESACFNQIVLQLFIAADDVVSLSNSG